MYMVPPECIGVDSETGESLYNKNPLTAEQYKKITENPERYTEVALNVNVKKLNSTLSEFIAQKNGVAQAEVVFVQAGEEPLVYYYMKFDN